MASVSVILWVFIAVISSNLIHIDATTELRYLRTRLVGGRTEYEGRLEVLYGDQWGTVCDDGWNETATDVACRSLGFKGGVNFTCCAAYGQRGGAIVLDDVQCNGDEYNIASCSHRPYLENDCGHSEDVGINCIPEALVRLADGSVPSEGRVELFHAGAWGTVCDYRWNLKDADVVCRMLGYPAALAADAGAHYGEGSGSILLDKVSCLGDEDNIFNCYHRGIGTHYCSHAQDAGVSCQVAASDDTTVSVRLADGRTPAEGRVEVYAQGEWGTVCDDGWTLDNAHVVCRMLGFPDAASTFPRAHFGPGSGRILLDDVYCSGDEADIFECSHGETGVHNCRHAEDAGVACNNKVRLVDGTNEAEGRVEVYANGIWGTVCDDDWDRNDGNVVCRMLGYRRARKALPLAYFGEGVGYILLVGLQCSGEETSIFQCPNTSIGLHNCNHREDAGVICTNKGI